MKKILLTAIIAIGICACSSDDTQPLLTEVPQQNVSDQYKMFMYSTNIELDNCIFKTKTGNGQWVEQQLQNWRIAFHDGDSIHISSNGQYISNGNTFIKYQINTHVDWFHEDNLSNEVRTYNGPIDRKFKVQNISNQ